MAQFYTLEEAARVLGMSVEELNSKAQAREVRAFLDGGSWRFRVVDVDELARRRGLGSDAELRLSDLEVPAAKTGSGEMEDLDLSEFHLGVAKPDLGAQSGHISKAPGQGEVAVIFPERISGDIRDNDGFRAVGGRSAGSRGRANETPVDRVDILRREAWRRAVPELPGVRIQQEN